MSGSPTPYSPEYYQTIVDGSGRSAEIIVPIVIDLVGPRSVVDVGCGTGAWLSAFSRAGVQTIRGIDGDYVRRDQLLIPAEWFTAADISRRLPSHDRFDLAVCLEVAEHLPPERSGSLVEELTFLADVVLFSAAAPYAGGRAHINERWPTFWAELFACRGYRVIDAVRRRVWSDRRVEPWYQQNTLIFAAEHAIDARPALRREYERTDPNFLSLIHPRLYGLLLEREGIKPAGPWQPGHDWERVLAGEAPGQR